MGAGLSPFVGFELATFALIGYLLLSIHVFITTYVTGEFKISYARLGPTEARVLAIIGNTVIMVMAKPFMTFWDSPSPSMISSLSSSDRLPLPRSSFQPLKQASYSPEPTGQAASNQDKNSSFIPRRVYSGGFVLW
jgi:hypothetical protein